MNQALLQIKFYQKTIKDLSRPAIMLWYRYELEFSDSSSIFVITVFLFIRSYFDIFVFVLSYFN